MKKGMSIIVMTLFTVFIGNVALAMDVMPSTGSCSMDNMEMGCSDMSSCDHTACTCNHMESAGCQPGCTCCAMCADGGCDKSAGSCCNMSMTNANIDFYPGNINVKSKSLYVTAYIEIEDSNVQYTIDQINKDSICLIKADTTMIKINGEMLCTVGPIEYGDYDEDGIPDLMMKFDRQALSNFLITNGFQTGDVSLTLTGQFYDGSKFKGIKNITISIKK